MAASERKEHDPVFGEDRMYRIYRMNGDAR